MFDKQNFTIGDFYRAVLSVHDGAEARAFYEDYVQHNMAHAMDVKYRTPEGAANLAKANIGWVFGEGMPQADMIMWAEACGASHPVFGDSLPRLTPEEIFQRGLELGTKQ